MIFCLPSFSESGRRRREGSTHTHLSYLIKFSWNLKNLALIIGRRRRRRRRRRIWNIIYNEKRRVSTHTSLISSEIFMGFKKSSINIFTH